MVSCRSLLIDFTNGTVTMFISFCARDECSVFKFEYEQLCRKDEWERVLKFHKWLVELSQLELLEEQQEFTDGIKEVLFEFEKRYPELRQQVGEP